MNKLFIELTRRITFSQKYFVFASGRYGHDRSLFYGQFFLRSKGWFSSYRVFVTAAISDLQKKGEPELFSTTLTEARRNRSRKNQNVSISSDFVCGSVAYDPVKPTLSESEAEAEKPTNHKAWNRLLWLVYSSASTQFWPSLGRKRESHKQNRCYVSDSVGLIFTRSGTTLRFWLP